MDSENTSIYIHIPFCTHRCAYCDFNTYAGLQELIPAYVKALCSEIRYAGRDVGQKFNIHTVFFGGGTPSLLSAEQIHQILSTVDQTFNLINSPEITLEANPGTLSRQFLRDLFTLGINRLSLGMQSANSHDLTVLERQHDSKDVVNAVIWARQAGFMNINLDLIYGIPYQSFESWKNTLAYALSLQPEHLSLYALSIEQDTMLASWVRRGLITAGDPDMAADMYDYACEYLQAGGYQHYEISNWAKESNLVDFSCKHNLQYWRSEPYLGFGAGAHGIVNDLHTIATLNPSGYIRRMQAAPSSLEFPRTPATVSASVRSAGEAEGDFMIMGLRLLKEGISPEKFISRFGIGLEDKYEETLTRLLKENFLQYESDSWRLTQKSYLLANIVFREFV